MASGSERVSNTAWQEPAQTPITECGSEAPRLGPGDQAPDSPHSPHSPADSDLHLLLARADDELARIKPGAGAPKFFGPKVPLAELLLRCPPEFRLSEMLHFTSRYCPREAPVGRSTVEETKLAFFGTVVSSLITACLRDTTSSATAMRRIGLIHVWFKSRREELQGTLRAHAEERQKHMLCRPRRPPQQTIWRSMRHRCHATPGSIASTLEEVEPAVHRATTSRHNEATMEHFSRYTSPDLQTGFLQRQAVVKQSGERMALELEQKRKELSTFLATFMHCQHEAQQASNSNRGRASRESVAPAHSASDSPTTEPKRKRGQGRGSHRAQSTSTMISQRRASRTSKHSKWRKPVRNESSNAPHPPAERIGTELRLPALEEASLPGMSDGIENGPDNHQSQESTLQHQQAPQLANSKGQPSFRVPTTPGSMEHLHVSVEEREFHDQSGYEGETGMEESESQGLTTGHENGPCAVMESWPTSLAGLALGDWIQDMGFIDGAATKLQLSEHKIPPRESPSLRARASPHPVPPSPLQQPDSATPRANCDSPTGGEPQPGGTLDHRQKQAPEVTPEGQGHPVPGEVQQRTRIQKGEAKSQDEENLDVAVIAT